jgi:hypothetical protein
MAQGDPADTLDLAASRLEAAVDRLADAIGPLAAAGPGSAESPGSGDGMVPRQEIAVLADRLDATLLRLRAALAEELRRGEDERAD